MSGLYLKIDNDISGPYSISQILNMSLMDNTFISNDKNGEWISLNENRGNIKKGELLKLLLEKRLLPIKNDEENEHIFDVNEDILKDIDSKIGLNKIQCPYSVNAEYVKELQHIHIIGICEPTYYILPSGFIVGLVEGAKIFPRFLNDEVSLSTNEILCIVLLDKEQKEFASYLLNPSPSSLYALGRTNDNMEVIKIARECNAYYRGFVTSTYRAICFGRSCGESHIVWPYNTMRPWGVTNAHRSGDTYGTDSLRYNLYKVFIQPSKAENVDLMRNPLLSVYYMKDQQWGHTYSIAKDIVRKLAQLFCFSGNENVVFDKNNIEDSFWGQDGKLLICNIRENIKKLNQSYPISDLKELFNSFYFWEYNIKLAIQKSYTKRIFSNTNSRILEFYLPLSLSTYSILDLGNLMITILNVPDAESKLLRQDWIVFTEITERQKLAIALKGGRKIYITKNGKITLDPKDANGNSNFCIHKGKFALK